MMDYYLCMEFNCNELVKYLIVALLSKFTNTIIKEQKESIVFFL